jgi:predicted secreted protein
MTKEKNEDLKIEVGQAIDISLESMMGSTGYGWEVSELTGSVYLFGITTTPSQSGTIGPVTQSFHLRGAKVGKGKITFVLTAAWKVEDPIKILTYDFIVTEAKKPSEDDLKLDGFVAAPQANVRQPQPNQPVSLYAVWPPYGIPDYWQRLYYGTMPPQNANLGDPRLYYGVCCAPSANAADPRLYYGVCCAPTATAADPRLYYGVCCAPTASADPRVYYGVCCAPQDPRLDYGVCCAPDDPRFYYGVRCAPDDPRVYYGVCCAPDDPRLYYGVKCATDFDQSATPPQIFKYGILPRLLYGIPPVSKYNIPPMMRYNYPGSNC